MTSAFKSSSMWLILLIVILGYDGGGMLTVVQSIKLDKVWIPEYGVKDGSVTLGCDFSLEDDTLLVLKWYKDGHEFFRYSPQQSSPLTPFNSILTFPIDGVYVDKSKSGLNRVLLQNITLQTSGLYKCEVSADRPSFRTLSKEGNMMVIAPPDSLPEITGEVNGVIRPGERLVANCTSYRSKPPAALSFSVNEEHVDESQLIRYPIVKGKDGLESATLGLKLYVEPRHFQDGMLELKCTATIGNGYWIRKKLLSQEKIKAQLSVAGHDPLLSGTWSLGSLRVYDFLPSVFAETLALLLIPLVVES